MRSGQMAGGVDHDHDHEPEDEADARRRQAPAVLGVGDDRAAAGEDEREGGETLGEGAPPQVMLAVH